MPQSGFVIRLLGTPSVGFADGRQATPAPGGKAIALLAYLALEPGPHSREELAGLLWGESPEAEARASLRQTLRAIRAAFGDVITSDRSVARLETPPAVMWLNSGKHWQRNPGGRSRPRRPGCSKASRCATLRGSRNGWRVFASLSFGTTRTRFRPWPVTQWRSGGGGKPARPPIAGSRAIPSPRTRRGSPSRRCTSPAIAGGRSPGSPSIATRCIGRPAASPAGASGP